MSAFLAIAGDVPRRLSRGWIMWILLVLITIFIAFFVGSVGKGVGADGTAYLTFFGQDTRPPAGSGVPVMAAEAALVEYLRQFFGVFLASYVGVFSGLVFLADAVTSAFAPGAAELNLPKPVGRSTILLARHAGALSCALGFATFLMGGSVLVAFLRTGIFAWRVLLYVPGSVVIFGLLHAVGSIGGVALRNAFFTAFGAVMAWLVSGITEIPAALKLETHPVTLFQTIAAVSKAAHRILPRANDLSGFMQRVLQHQPLDPVWQSDDIELAANLLVWWFLALLVACLVVRRRDF